VHPAYLLVASAVAVMLLFPQFSKAQDSLVWFPGGVREGWYFQPDVYAFRCVDGLAFSGLVDDDGVMEQVV
jgi:hypothetical protein